MLIIIGWIILILSLFRKLNTDVYSSSENGCLCNDLIPSTLINFIVVSLNFKRYGFLLLAFFLSIFLYLIIEFTIIITTGSIIEGINSGMGPVILSGFLFYSVLEIFILCVLAVWLVWNGMKNQYKKLRQLETKINEKKHEDINYSEGVSPETLKQMIVDNEWQNN
jgi:hypothetical protein